MVCERERARVSQYVLLVITLSAISSRNFNHNSNIINNVNKTVDKTVVDLSNKRLPNQLNQSIFVALMQIREASIRSFVSF